MSSATPPPHGCPFIQLGFRPFESPIPPQHGCCLLMKPLLALHAKHLPCVHLALRQVTPPQGCFPFSACAVILCASPSLRSPFSPCLGSDSPAQNHPPSHHAVLTYSGSDTPFRLPCVWPHSSPCLGFDTHTSLSIYMGTPPGSDSCPSPCFCFNTVLQITPVCGISTHPLGLWHPAQGNPSVWTTSTFFSGPCFGILKLFYLYPHL